MIEAVRVKKLQQILQEKGDAPFLLTDLANIFYFTGFTGSAGFLLVLPDGRPVFLCDGRYTTQANGELKIDTEIVEYDAQAFQKIADIIYSHGYHSAYFETSLSYQSYRSLQEKDLELLPAPAWVVEMRMIKSNLEIELIHKALQLSEKALRGIRSLIQPGVTEKDLAIELDYQIMKSGCESVAFPTIVASGERSVLPHAQPTNASIPTGSWVVIDWGARYHGYCGDITRTVPVGSGGDGWFKENIRLVQEAQRLAQEAIRDGVRAVDVDRVARDFLIQCGIGQYFTHGLGHGVGIEIHEAPRLGSTSETVLRQGMVITVEPGIYLPGRGGIRLENMVVVEKDSCRILNSLPVILE